MNDLHVGIAASHHENVPLSSTVHHLSGPKHVCSRTKHSQDHGRRLNPICQPNTEHHDQKARASERRQACEMNGTPLRSSMLSFENLLLLPRSWWLERGLTRAHHRIIGTMQVHLRSSGFRWVLSARGAQIQEAFCAFDSGSHRGARDDCLRNSCARDLGMLWRRRSVSSGGSSCSISVSSKSVTLRSSWRQAFVVMLVLFHLDETWC